MLLKAMCLFRGLIKYKQETEHIRFFQLPGFDGYTAGPLDHIGHSFINIYLTLNSRQVTYVITFYILAVMFLQSCKTCYCTQFFTETQAIQSLPQSYKLRNVSKLGLEFQRYVLSVTHCTIPCKLVPAPHWQIVQEKVLISCDEEKERREVESLVPLL